MRGKLTKHFSMILLSLFPVAFFFGQFLLSGFFTEHDVLWVLGIILGLLSYILIWWQYILGIRPVAALLSKDFLATNKIHRLLGKYGFVFFVLHPVVLIIDFELRGFSLLNLSFANAYDTFIAFGKIAFALLIVIFITSVFLRNTISWRSWKRIHFLNYIILPLIFFHSVNVGTAFANRGLELYWYLLFFVFIIATLYRLLFQLGFTKYRYQVRAVVPVTYNTNTLVLAPLARRLLPKRGQFIYLQLNKFGEAHPFTVSHFDETSGELSITPKASGAFSTKLQETKPGQEVLIDGPYGVFTEEAYSTSRPIILIAGGIGITPFLRFIEYFQANQDKFKRIYLFYGNKSENDIAFRDVIDTIGRNSNFKVVHVLSGAEAVGIGIEKGFISVELIKKYVKEDLKFYDFFVCGPPVMMEKLEEAFVIEGLDMKNIYTEKFSL